MRQRHGSRSWKTLQRSAITVALALAAVRPAQGTPYDYIPVGDPIESELRILDLLDSGPLQGRIRLPHLATRPVQIIELEGIGSPPATPDVARAISLARIERQLGRDRSPLFAPHPLYSSTPRLLDYGSDAQMLQFSAGIEGRAESDRQGRRFANGSGVQGRMAVGLDRVEVFWHYTAGRYENARKFADPILPRNDFILLTEDTYLAYTEERGHWGVQFGRSRWNWGPGEEGTLVLSKTGPSLTGLAIRVRLETLRADAIALSATLRQAEGEQLAAHRLEWQPLDGLRVGVAEAARYKAAAWQPLYFVGAIPYVLVQRLLVQAEPESLQALRNNIITSFDFGWRIVPGYRLYGELLIDDLHARSGKYPNKIAYQAGWEGVAALGPTRMTWGGEVTRLTRYVYTSFFGRDYANLGQPLGFPTGPDARRIRVRAAWDLGPDWQIGMWATQTNKGENDLNEPFIPGSPRVNSFEFEGIVQRSRDVLFALRWWPASGIDLTVQGGYLWLDNVGHVQGARSQGARGAIQLRLTR